MPFEKVRSLTEPAENTEVLYLFYSFCLSVLCAFARDKSIFTGVSILHCIKEKINKKNGDGKEKAVDPVKDAPMPGKNMPRIFYAMVPL